jgi:hypothetical protein
VFVVTGCPVDEDENGVQVLDGRQVLGVLTSYEDAQDKMKLWGAVDWVGLDCTTHDIRYPLAKR